MQEETETEMTTAIGPPPSEGGEEQEQEESQRSSSGGSNEEDGNTNDEENKNQNNDDEGFVVDAAGTAEFVRENKKVTVYGRHEDDGMFPQSRKAAKEVSASRSMSFYHKVVRVGNGKNALNVETPLKLRDGYWLLLILVDYNKNLKGIVFNPENNTVTCSDSALSTICKDADGKATLNSADVDDIDEKLANYLNTLIRAEKITKSAEGEKKTTCTCLTFLIYYLFILLQSFSRNWNRVRRITTN